MEVVCATRPRSSIAIAIPRSSAAGLCTSEHRPRPAADLSSLSLHPGGQPSSVKNEYSAGLEHGDGGGDGVGPAAGGSGVSPAAAVAAQHRPPMHGMTPYGMPSHGESHRTAAVGGRAG